MAELWITCSWWFSIGFGAEEWDAVACELFTSTVLARRVVR